MSIRKNEYLKKEYLLDVSVDTGATAVSTITLRATDPNGNALPAGFVVSKASAHVESAISPTGGTLTLGISSDKDGFLQNFRSVYAASGSVVRSGEVAGDLLWDDTNDHEIDYRCAAATEVVADVTSSGLSTGKVRFILEGYLPSDAAGYEN